MNKYDLIIFDMDGTLIDSKLFHQEVFHRFINTYIGKMSQEHINKLMGQTVATIFQQAGVPHEKMNAMFTCLDHFLQVEIDDIIKEIGILPETQRTFSELRKKNINLALLTNSMITVVDRILSLHNLSKYFDYVSGADYNSTSKIERAQKITSILNPQKILYVGDTESDILFANEMNYESCFLKTSFSWYNDASYIQDILKPTYTIENIHDLLNLIEFV